MEYDPAEELLENQKLIKTPVLRADSALLQDFLKVNIKKLQKRLKMNNEKILPYIDQKSENLKKL